MPQTRRTLCCPMVCELQCVYPKLGYAELGLSPSGESVFFNCCVMLFVREALEGAKKRCVVLAYGARGLASFLLLLLVSSSCCPNG